MPHRDPETGQFTVDDDHETWTAAGQANVAAGTQEENTLEFSAREDRKLLAIGLGATQRNVALEVSWSSEQLLVGETVDESASGVILAGRDGSADSATNDISASKIQHLPLPQDWHAGEEIHVHANNFEASETQVRVVLYYERLGDPVELRG